MSVSETTADTPTATLNVIANSRNKRPTMPVMKSRGMKTATSEMLKEMTVNPGDFLFRALERGLHRFFARFNVAHDILNHHNRVIHHEGR